jgi:hypothetical protein
LVLNRLPKGTREFLGQPLPVVMGSGGLTKQIAAPFRLPEIKGQSGHRDVGRASSQFG